MTRAAPRQLMENFAPVITIDDARVAAGGRRRLRTTEAFDVTLEDGRVVEVRLNRRPWTFDSQRVFLVCPTCGLDVLVLRRVDEAPGLACKRDLQERHAAKYVSQVRWQRPRQPRQSISKEAPWYR